MSVAEARQEITQLCQQFHVRQLELFGSRASGEFDPAASDFDFLVEFDDMAPPDFGDAYFGMLAALEDLFDRPVDLVIRSAVRNPYLLESINQNRIMLYAA